jgi:hypothetical protein
MLLIKDVNDYYCLHRLHKVHEYIILDISNEWRAIYVFENISIENNKHTNIEKKRAGHRLIF